MRRQRRGLTPEEQRAEKESKEAFDFLKAELSAAEELYGESAARFVEARARLLLLEPNPLRSKAHEVLYTGIRALDFSEVKDWDSTVREVDERAAVLNDKIDEWLLSQRDRTDL